MLRFATLVRLEAPQNKPAPIERNISENIVGVENALRPQMPEDRMGLIAAKGIEMRSYREDSSRTNANL